MEKERLTQLVKEIQRGSEHAVTELYNGYHNDIYYYILKTLDKRTDPELAADLTQDTFIEILQTIDKLQDPEAFITWSRKIAYHRCTAYFRKRHELLVDEQEDGSTVFDTLVEDREEFIPGEALDREDLKNTIQEMIDSLPEEQRSAIMMRYFDELSVQKIADIQGTTEGTVKSRLNYGRKAIKKSVEDYEKKHGIKLHCAGVVPLLLWLFWEQKRTKAAAQLASLTSSGIPAAEGVRTETAVKATGVEKTGKLASKAITTKIIAVAVSATLAAGALGVGLSQAKSEKAKPDSETKTEQSAGENATGIQAAAVSPEIFVGYWTNGAEILEISYNTVAERYWFTYRATGETPFVFFADFDPAEGCFWAPEGHACGFEVTDAQGNTVLDWQQTDNPALRFTYQDDVILWEIGGSEPQTYFRLDGNGADSDPQSGVTGENAQSAVEEAARYLLEDYPVYGQKVAEYGAAIFSGDYSEERYPALNTHMLNYYHNFSEEAYFFYALEDVDKNGTPELLIGKGYSAEGKPEIIDLYSLCGGSLVQYFENPYFGERVALGILEGGMLSESGSSSASSGGCTIYQIAEDGGSVSMIAQYTYYYPDESMPAPEGDYLSPEAYDAAMAQYEPYPNPLHWFAINP